MDSYICMWEREYFFCDKKRSCSSSTTNLYQIESNRQKKKQYRIPFAFHLHKFIEYKRLIAIFILFSLNSARRSRITVGGKPKWLTYTAYVSNWSNEKTQQQKTRTEKKKTKTDQFFSGFGWIVEPIWRCLQWNAEHIILQLVYVMALFSRSRYTFCLRNAAFYACVVMYMSGNTIWIYRYE